MSVGRSFIHFFHSLPYTLFRVQGFQLETLLWSLYHSHYIGIIGYCTSFYMPRHERKTCRYYYRAAFKANQKLHTYISRNDVPIIFIIEKELLH